MRSEEINQQFFGTDHLNKDLKRRALSGAGATVIANALSFAMQFSSTIILARLLTPDDFGLITMVTTFSLLLQNFGVNGFTESIIQKKDLNHQMMSTLFWLNAVISSLLTILFILAGPVLQYFYKEPRLSFVCTFMAFSIIASGITTMHTAILRRRMQFYVVSAISVLGAFIGITAAILLAIFDFGYWALASNSVIQPTVLAIGSWTYCRWRPGRPGNYFEIKSIVKFASSTYGNFILNYFSRNTDKLLLGRYYGASILGLYKKAYDLFVLPANQLTYPLANVALAALSRLREDPKRYRFYYIEAVSIIAFIGMPLSALLTLSGSDIILFVLGPQWSRAGSIFCYFGASIGVMLIYGTQGWLHLSLGKPNRWLKWGLVECAITLLIFSAGLPFGPEGVAIGYASSFYVLLGPCLYYAGRPIKLRLSSLFSVVWRYFIAASASYAVSFIVLHRIDPIAQSFTNQHVFFRIVEASAICSITYLILVVLLHRSLQPIRKFKQTLSQMMPRRS